MNYIIYNIKDKRKKRRVAKRTIFRTIIVRMRMWYADIRGHHGKRWDYEPGDWYMGRHNKRK